MNIRNREYPYPVLEEGNNSFNGSYFKSSAEAKSDVHNIEFILNAETDNKDLIQYIKEDKAIFVHHIECPETCYRKIIKTNHKTKVFSEKSDLIKGNVQVCSFIIANKYIENYSNKYFNSIYNGFNFNIEKGCILAVGNETDITIEKNSESLADRDSIFKVIKVEKRGSVEVDIEDEKIQILLPEKTFKCYRQLNKGIENRVKIYSLIVLPVLIYVIEMLKTENGIDYYENKRWFKSLKNISSKFGIILDSENIFNINSLECAQKLLNNCLIDSIEQLGSFDVEGSDCDED